MAQQIDPNQQYNFDPNQGLGQPNPNQGFVPPAPQPNPYNPNPQIDPVYDPNASTYPNYPDPNQYAPNPSSYPEQPQYDPNTQYPPQSPTSYPAIDPAAAYYNPNQYQQQPSQGYDPNTVYSNDPNANLGYPQTPQYQDPYAPVQPVAAYPPADPYSGYQNVDPYTASYNGPAQPLDPNGSFEVKKSGSRTFLIVGVSIIIVLLVATLAIFYMLNNQGSGSSDTDTNNTSSDNLNSQEQSSSSQVEDSSSSSTTASTDNTGLTTNEGTPAGDAKVNAGKTITPQWLIQYFSTNGAVDENGNCLQINICGESADPDKDGLKNSEEFEYDTDPLNPDTDGDGISDGNEVLVYFTHPRIKDSDSDGEEDGAEIVACTDPIRDGQDKASSQRRAEIAKLLEIWKLTEPTIATLEAADATPDDINKGFIEASCTGITVEL
jgi:hypothetical protein